MTSVKKKRRKKPKARTDLHCLHCEIYIPTLPKVSPRFCSIECAGEYAIEHTESWRLCIEVHGWWDAAWYGMPDSSLGCWECHMEKEG